MIQIYNKFSNSWYPIYETLMLRFLDFLNPSMEAFKELVQYNNSNLFGFVLLFFIGICCEISVYVSLKLGFSLDVRSNKSYLGFRFWFAYALPTGITLIGSVYSFWVLSFIDFNGVNGRAMLSCACASLCMLTYLSYFHFYLKAPLGRQFTVLQAFGIILSDTVAGFLAAEGWAFSIILMISINVAVTVISYKITQNTVYSYVERLNSSFLNKINQVLVFFKWNPRFLNTYANVERNYAYAMYSVLVSSKTFLWTSGVFFGPAKIFDNVALGYASLLVLGLIWYVSSVRFLYCAAVCISANRQQLIYPWEVSIAYMLSPAGTILTIMRANVTYFKIHGYRKLLRMLRTNCHSSKPVSPIGEASRWVLENITYAKTKPDYNSPVIWLVNRFFKAQIRRYVCLYALINALLRPCVLLGKAWVSYQPYFANLQRLLDFSLNVINPSPSTWREALKKASQFAGVIATLGTITGVAIAPVIGEMSARQDACTDVNVGEDLSDINKKYPNKHAQPDLVNIKSSLALAKTHCNNAQLRNPCILQASRSVLDFFSRYGLSSDEITAPGQGIKGMASIGIKKIIEKANASK